MRRITIIICLALCIFYVNDAIAEPQWLIKMGIDMPGDYHVSGMGLSGTTDVETGFSVAGEFISNIKSQNNISFGLGLEYQIPRSQKELQGDFYFIPIYGLMKIHLNKINEISPYLNFRLGYNLFDGDNNFKGTGLLRASLDGGLYYALGIGAITGRYYAMEITYSVNRGEGNIAGVGFDVEYSKVGLSIGYIFD